MSTAHIRVGIGGWTYEPWRGTFYPPGLPASRELEYASRQTTAIEVNGTYYSTFKPETFAKWRDTTPDGFVFSLKANRFTTNRRVLADAGESVERFVGSGIAELGDKLGPIVWQFAPTKQFDAADFGAFLSLLPAKAGGLPLRHVMEVRNASFACDEYVTLARQHGATTVFTDSDEFPSFADSTGPLVYARLLRCAPDIETGYPAAALDTIAATAREWAAGTEPGNLPRVTGTGAPSAPRDVFIYFINGAKEHAPAAAKALIGRLA